MSLRAFLANIRFELRGVRPARLPPYARRVLIYHGVTKTGDRRFNSRFVSTQRLAADLCGLAAIPGLRFVPLATLFDEPSDPAPRVAVTFDDGYRNFLTQALPVLEATGVPATLYVTALHAAPLLPHGSGFLPSDGAAPCLWADRLDLSAWLYPGLLAVAGELFAQGQDRQWYRAGDRVPLKHLCKTRRPDFLAALLHSLDTRWQQPSTQAGLPPDLDDYWHLLDAAAVQQLARHPLVTIGAHGVTHCNFPTLSASESRSELAVGKRWLEHVTGCPVEDFAWPHGDHDPGLVDEAQAAGYRRQGLTDYRSAEEARDPRLINRLGVNPYISARAQRAIIAAGGYGHEVHGT